MGPVFVYPGSFCPPTFGHLYVVQKAAKIFEHLFIICSVNPNKSEQLFTSEECADLWKSYPLPKNVTVTVLDEFAKKGVEAGRIVIIRGVRDGSDFDHEKGVVFLNYETMGIDKYFYLVSDNNHKNISSSSSRQLAKEMKLEKLSEYVSPSVVLAMLEKHQERKVKS